MAGQCCTGEGPSRRIAPRLSVAIASILPGAVLVLLPKCPLCLAAWLTLITGVGVSAAAAASVGKLVVVFLGRSRGTRRGADHPASCLQAFAVPAASAALKGKSGVVERRPTGSVTSSANTPYSLRSVIYAPPRPRLACP